jgi:hypothetical protein
MWWQKKTKAVPEQGTAFYLPYDPCEVQEDEQDADGDEK